MILLISKWFVSLVPNLRKKEQKRHDFLPAPALFAGGRCPRLRAVQRAALRSATADKDEDGVLQGVDEDQHPGLPWGGL